MRSYLIALALAVSFACAQEQHPAPGTTIIRFTKIDDRIFAGSKPHTDADFQFLQSQGIRYILEVKFLPFFTGSEKAAAKRHGLQFLSVPINASFISPSERHVDKALRIMRTQQPIYLHCVLGRDRTSMLAALYRMYFQGVSQEKAWEEMKAEGFRDVWYLSGLKRYFQHHPKPPADLSADSPNRISNSNALR